MSEGGFGYGQQGPEDSASGFNVQTFIIQQMLNRISTMKLVVVKAVDSDKGTVNVQPLVNQLDGSGNATPHGTVFGLPYVRMQGGTNAVIMTPKVGDLGLIVIADRDTSAARAAKGIANPGSLRKFNAADGVYIGGILNGVPDQTVEFTDDGVVITDKNGHKIEMKSTGVEITGDVKVNGKIEATAGVTAGLGGGDQVTLQHHLHGGVTVGAGTTAVPTAGT